jgi:hypothetical protein
MPSHRLFIVYGSDEQSLHGKVVSALANDARRNY